MSKIDDQWLARASAHATKALSGEGFNFSAQAFLDLLDEFVAQRTRIKELEDGVHSILERHPDPSTDVGHPAVAIARRLLAKAG